MERHLSVSRGEAGMSRQQVLIVDDDRDIAKLFQVVLNLVGFECLSKLALSVPDIILLDLRLGLEISGGDILFQIRANPRFKNTRVIVVTGYPSLAEPIADLTDMILLKPVEIEQLKVLIQRLASVESKPGLEYFRDPVTGLFNEEFFATRLELAFERSKRKPDFLYACVVFTIDFENLPIQEMTVPIYDDIMRAVGRRLLKIFRPTDTLARFGHKKFVSLHEDLKQAGDVQIITSRLASKLLQPYGIDKEIYQPSLCLGAALSTSEHQSAMDILEAAEQDLKPLQPAAAGLHPIMVEKQGEPAGD
jgi:diguanylate cyclase (GGDEF)-like protein